LTLLPFLFLFYCPIDLLWVIHDFFFGCRGNFITISAQVLTPGISSRGVVTPVPTPGDWGYLGWVG